MTPELRKACKRAIHVVLPDGKILRAGRAGLFILGQSGYPILARIAGWTPFVWGVEIVYWLIARYRGKLYKWFFRRVDPQRDEPMPH